MEKRKGKCCIENCTEISEQRLRYFKFPNDNSANFMAWVEAAGPYLISGYRKNLQICALHFTKDSFEQSDIVILRDGQEVTIPRTVQRLKKNAIPTIFPEITAKLITKETKPVCVVKCCPGQDSNDIKLFLIPSYDLINWLINLKLKKKDIDVCSRVCSRHFEKACFNDDKLKHGARPTLNLGHSAKNIVPSNIVANNKIPRQENVYLRTKKLSPAMKKLFNKNRVKFSDSTTTTISTINTILYGAENSKPQKEKHQVYFEIEEIDTEIKTEPLEAMTDDSAEDIENSNFLYPEIVLKENNAKELETNCEEVEIKTEPIDESILPDITPAETSICIKTEPADLEDAEFIALSSAESTDEYIQPTSIEIENSNNRKYDEKGIQVNAEAEKCKSCAHYFQSYKITLERCRKLQHWLSDLRGQNITLQRNNELLNAELLALKRPN